jgi:hypothetical protein
VTAISRPIDLFERAVAQYGATCLWNIVPKNDADGLRVIAEKLKSNGDMAAWRLALEIEQALRRGD